MQPGHKKGKIRKTDDKGEFAEDMQAVELENARVYFLQPDNQFQTKVFLERIDRTTVRIPLWREGAVTLFYIFRKSHSRLSVRQLRSAEYCLP